MSLGLSESLLKLSLNNTQPNAIFYMLGRFQPFTMGHLALFNNMVLEASSEQGRHAYLFVSHKKPNFSRAKVGELLEILEGSSPTVKNVKPLMKKDKSIMDNPLSTLVRFQIVSMLMKSVYNVKSISKRGEEVFILNKVLDIDKMFKTGDKKGSMIALDNQVEVHIVNSEVTGTGGFKAHGFLKNRYGKVPARMFTGTNREGRLAPFIMANKPIFVKREEGDTSDAFHPSGLSGSKIRSWSVIYFKTQDETMLENISKSYYGVLSDSKIKKYIIEPISNSIFSGKIVSELSEDNQSASNSNSTSNELSSVSASGKRKRAQQSNKKGRKTEGAKRTKRRNRRFTLKQIND